MRSTGYIYPNCLNYIQSPARRLCRAFLWVIVMSYGFHVRDANEVDIPNLHCLGSALHKASSFSTYEYDAEAILLSMRRAVSGDGGLILKVAVDDKGAISGAILAEIFKPHHSNALFSCDIAFVSLVQRQGVAKSLIREYEDECLVRGVSRIMLGVGLGLNNEAGYQLLNGLGYSESGRMYIKV